MANQAHVNKLKAGFEVWNQWRTDSLSELPDLSHADLSRVDLSQVNLRNVNLRNADLSHANLNKASLGSAKLQEAKLLHPDNTVQGFLLFQY